MTTSVRRLYKELKPQSYALRIEPDISTMSFKGEVIIKLKKTGRPSQRLTFHQHGLKIDNARIIRYDKKGQRELPITRINNQDSLDEVRLHTEELIYSGEFEIHMSFHGTIIRGMTGIYPAYFKHEGSEHVMLATQFESHHAREAFPCIDEPEAKATFDLVLVSPADQAVISNTTPAQTKNLPDGSIETTFETTPKMPTYLLAFAIGELHRKSGKTSRGTEVSIWATIAQPANAFEFALGIAIRSIEFFEDYFGVNYPLSKADHLALPDFSSGAMENWGLVTYRERLLMAYPGETSQSTKEGITLVIAHETSHQWFGNLVTMRWWDDLWLNESFANLMEFQAPDALFPEWQVWNEFAASDGLSALRRDASPNVQALRTNIHHPTEINTLFDPSIVYAKGGRLLYMLKNFIGEDAFRKGLKAYFTKHAYGNTTRDDLWTALSEASGLDVAAFMNPWLDQAGFPVISVEQNGKHVDLSQHRFLEDGSLGDARIWPVPLFANHPEMQKTLQKANKHATLDDDKPLMINQGAAGYYMVNYTQPKHRSYLADLVSQNKLSVPERLMLLNNASMLSKAKYAPFADVLRLLATYEDEEDEAVWGVMALVIYEARRFIDLDESLEEPIKSLVRHLIQKEYKRLGWEAKKDESTSDVKQRATIVALGTYADNPEIVAGALERYQAYKKGRRSVDAELRSIIFGAPIKNNIDGAFEYLLQLYDNTNNGDIKTDAMVALGGTTDPEQAKILTGRLTNANLVKPQDIDHWLAYLLRNRYVRKIAWDWMETSWPWLEKTFSNDKSYDYLPRYAAGACNTREWAEKFAAFFGPKQDQIALKRNIVVGLSEIETRVNWLERDLSTVRDFLKA